MATKNATPQPINYIEPIKIKTTTLKINVKTTGDLITKEYDLIPFHPNMSDMKDLSNNNYILFPSFVKITMNDLKNAGVGQDYQKVFTQLDKYLKLIEYVTSSDHEDDSNLIVQTGISIPTGANANANANANGPNANANGNTSISISNPFFSSDTKTIQKYEHLTDDEIITNNILLIKNLFFPQKGKFFVLDHEYFIGKSKYLEPYKPSTQTNENITSKQIPLYYTITIEIQLLDSNNSDFGGFNKLSCKDKKVTLLNDARDMFGLKIDNLIDKKVVLPSLLSQTSTTTKRGFGKLQLEWEKRNQYVKPPETEEERLKMEKNKSPLQKKMDKYDKELKEFNKIPPAWIKERAELKQKYDQITKQINNNEEEIKKIRKENTQIPPNPFIESQIKELEDKNVLLKQQNTEVAKQAEEKLIDDKYTKDIVDDMKNKKEILDNLIKEKNDLLTVLGNMAPNDYNLSEKKKDLAELQSKILKKQTEYDLLKTNYGENGEKIITTWTNMQNKMNNVLKDITGEKEKDTIKVERDSIKVELKEKFDEILKIKKEILIAKYYSGDYDELTKNEKESFKKEDRPYDDLETLESKLKELEEEYLTISNKLGILSKIQGRINLLTNDSDRFKFLRDSKKTEKGSLDTSISSIVRQLYELTRSISSDTSEKRKQDLEKEQLTAQEAIDKLTPIIEKNEKYMKFYNEYINDHLKKINEKYKDIEELYKAEEAYFIEIKKLFDEYMKTYVEPLSPDLIEKGKIQRDLDMNNNKTKDEKELNNLFTTLRIQPTDNDKKEKIKLDFFKKKYILRLSQTISKLLDTRNEEFTQKYNNEKKEKLDKLIKIEKEKKPLQKGGMLTRRKRKIKRKYNHNTKKYNRKYIKNKTLRKKRAKHLRKRKSIRKNK